MRRERQLILEHVLGQGAVATVYAVRDAETGTTYAGKVLHASQEEDEAAAARFAQEARLLADVHHENLVAVHGFETIEGKRVLLMELVDGPDLATLIATEAPLPLTRLVALALQIARGLAAAHAAGIIHRDLKPSNVLVAGGTVPKIADFGMARASSIAGVDPRAFAVVGTPDYMAPECLDPLAVDARSDLYALGCMIHEMATGRPPYGAATPFGVLSEHRTAPIPDLPDHYGAALRELFVASVAKSPADRPQSAAAVASALERIESGESRALQLAGPTASSRCASCAGPLVTGLGVCLTCGMPTARIEAGPCTLLVVGPGKAGEKLDSRLREALRTWLLDNPDLGLAPAKDLEKTIPRLPFTLVGNISEESGRSLQRSLERLGLAAEVVRGGPLASPLMRKKVRDLSGRVFLISVTMMAGILSQGWMVLVGVTALLGIVVATAVLSVRAVARETGGRARALPAPIRVALGRVESALPAIAEARHRESLRAAVSRATELARVLPEADKGDPIADELAQAIDAATVASARLDALDRELAQLDRDTATEAARSLLHERDTWSARLLSLTATLESLRARIARAEALRGRADDETLADLRAQVEALEEVQAG